MMRAKLIPLVFLGGCQFIPGSETAKIAEAEKSVARNLHDPDSAKFRDERLSKDGKFVCGEVNAKNGFGAYIGYTPYAYSLPQSRSYIYDADIEPSDETFPTACLSDALMKQISSNEADIDAIANGIERNAALLDEMANSSAK